MKIRNALVALACILALSACAGPQVNPNDPQAVLRGIQVLRDDYQKLTTYVGPDVGTVLDELLIRAARSDGGSLRYQIYVGDVNRGLVQRFYDTAFDSNGTKLDVSVISRELVACTATICAFSEKLGINVGRDYLEKNREQGIRIKIIGKGGEQVFFIPPAYVSAFLTGVK